MFLGHNGKIVLSSTCLEGTFPSTATCPPLLGIRDPLQGPTLVSIWGCLRTGYLHGASLMKHNHGPAVDCRSLVDAKCQWVLLSSPFFLHSDTLTRNSLKPNWEIFYPPWPFIFLMSACLLPGWSALLADPAEWLSMLQSCVVSWHSINYTSSRLQWAPWGPCSGRKAPWEENHRAVPANEMLLKRRKSGFGLGKHSEVHLLRSTSGSPKHIYWAVTITLVMARIDTINKGIPDWTATVC